MNDHLNPIFAYILDGLVKHICDDCPIYGDVEKMEYLCKRHCEEVREGKNDQD